jgi:hypothetical protein
LYCDDDPVPLSPMIANFRESGWFGSETSCAAVAPDRADEQRNAITNRVCERECIVNPRS